MDRLGRRYRAALLRQALIWALLAAGLAAIVRMKLGAAGLSGWWSWAAPAVVAALSLAGLAAALKPRWIGGRDLAARLDATLGLKQRLVTAEEFAAAPERPALYPLLIEDASRLFAGGTVRIPRAMPRAARIAALVLLVLWLLPWPRRGGAGVQIARQPQATHPQDTPPPPQPDQQQQQQDQQPQQQQQGQQQHEQQSQQPQSAGSSAQQQQQPQPSARGDESQPDGAGSGDTQPQPGAADGQSQQQQAQESGGSSAEQQRKTDEARTDSQRAQDRQAPRGGTQARHDGGTQGAQQRQQQAQGAQQTAQGTAGGEGEALKADIQQLLRELSQELDQLQQQLAQAQAQDAPPAPGTASDPELYGASEPLPPRGTNPVPIQLETDPAQTQTRRPGAGVGRPGEEISREGPRAQAEEAALSAQPWEEQPGSRQAVPAEYRSVFERLRHLAAPAGVATKEP